MELFFQSRFNYLPPSLKIKSMLSSFRSQDYQHLLSLFYDNQSQCQIFFFKTKIVFLCQKAMCIWLTRGCCERIQFDLHFFLIQIVFERLICEAKNSTFLGIVILLLIRVEMTLALFSVRNQWYRNGIWWFTKIANRIVGEQTYDSLRVQRRILSNKFYYLRQQVLYRTYIESPDVANMIGIYPKTDSSHGYGNPISYEMYRDFQENTINSDGSFGMWTVVICAIYLGHALYSYFIPWYWNKVASCKNGEEQRIRLRDVLSSAIVEDSMGYQFLEWGFAPHYTYYVRHKLVEGHAHPDDVRAMACSGLNRKNRYVEHYAHTDNKRMIGAF